MRTREESSLKTTDLFDLIAPPCSRTVVETNALQVDLTSDQPSIRINAGEGRVEVPSTLTGLFEIGNWLDVPNKFQERLDPDIHETLINALLRRSTDEALVLYNDTGLQDVVKSNARVIDPRAVVDIAARTVGGEATVTDWRKDSTGYGFDLVVPVDAPEVGGDRHIGDLTRGGLRFGQDTKHNLAPFVQTYLYRLICTNGMEIPSVSSISARGATEEMILEDLENEAGAAFARIDHDIRAFYSLRETRVANPEQTLVRLCGEHGISDRIMAHLLRDLPEYVEEDGATTMFQLVNLITNYANDEALFNQFNARRSLQIVGGILTNDHSSRCPTCRSKLNA